MINPRLGVLALSALNPKGNKMARKHGARHMAWVRSFRKNAHHARRHKSYRRKRNAYPMAGTVAALGNPRHRRRHRKHNPFTFSRSALGLPALQPVLFGAGGFIATAAVQGFVDTLVPASWKTNADGTQNVFAKYGEIAVSIFIVSMVGKMLLGSRGDTTMLAVGGGIYAMQQAAHDFLPNVIPGMHAYTPLKAYTPLRSGSTMGRSIESAGGSFPQLATRASMRQLAAPDHGAQNNANFADDGGMNLVSSRFRRFA